MTTIVRRRRAPRGQGGALRGELIAAAKQLLADTGDEAAVSVRAVADRVGVTTPAVYLHFADKQALMQAVCEEVFADLDTAMERAAASTTDPLEALYVRGVAYVEFALTNPEHYRIALLDRPRQLASPRDLVAKACFAHHVAAVETCVEAGIFAGDPLELGLSLWSAAHGLATLMITYPQFPWPPQEKIVSMVMQMSGLGLRAVSATEAAAATYAAPSR